MTTAFDKQKKLHFDVTNVGLRAQATATGFLQLCQELRQAGVIDDAAVDRIKGAIADEITLCAPRAVANQNYRREVRERLDQLFAGEKSVGPADELAFGAEPECAQVK